MKILQIEDNDRNAYLVSYILNAAGHVVDRAPDGPAGLELAESGDYALILLDIQLPGMNGYEIAKKLRESLPDRRIGVVAVTSFAMAGDREKALDAGCDGYIEKPIDPATFWADIERQLPWLKDVS